MTDAEIILLVIQSGGSVNITSTPGTKTQEVYTFPSTESLYSFIIKVKDKICE